MRRRTVVSKATRRDMQARANAQRVRMVAVASGIDKGRVVRPVTVEAGPGVSVGRAAADAVEAEHVTAVAGSGDAWSASCSCSWATKKPTAERYARGAATKHKRGFANAAATAALAVA